MYCHGCARSAVLARVSQLQGRPARSAYRNSDSMRLLRAHCPQDTMTSLNAYAIASSMFIASVSGNVWASNSPEAVVVSSPSQFQRSVREGVRHIIIGEHLDMTNTPRFLENTISDSGMIAIVPNDQNTYDFTKSIQVRRPARRTMYKALGGTLLDLFLGTSPEWIPPNLSCWCVL